MPPEERQLAPPMHIQVALHDVLAPAPLRLAKLTNVVSIQPLPFDPETYQVESNEYEDERGQKRIRLGSANSMRWRWAAGADGALERESNARLVRWSDGSVTLVVGDEVLDAKEIDVTGDNTFLCVRHSNLIQGQGRLNTKMVFRPASLSSSTHRRLAAVVDRHHKPRQQRVRATTTVVDPNKEKEAREKAVEDRIKAKEKLAGRQQRQMQRYVPVAAPRHNMLSAAYLEEEDEEEEEDDGWLVRDEEEDEGGEASGEGRRLEESSGGEEGPGAGGAMKRPRASGIEEEAEAERRLAAAKSAPAPAPPQRRGGVLADSDEEISGEDEGPASKKKRVLVMESDSE